MAIQSSPIYKKKKNHFKIGHVCWSLL